MRTVNTATYNAWNTIAYTKRRIYLPDLSTSIPDENISLIKFTESISDDDCLYFVGCVASKVEITLENIDINIHLDSIEIYAQRGTTTELKIFTGKVYTCDVNEATKTMKVVAYDHLYRIFNADLTEWYASLNLPMSMSAFRSAFFSHFNVTQVSRTLLFDNMQVQRTIGGDEILGRDLIKPLCEANCVFGHINADGQMDYFLPSGSARETTVAETSSFVKADYETALIDKVIVRGDEQDIGAIAGTGSNAYIIEGNIFFLGQSAADLQTIANTILGALDDITYRPLECEIMYNPIYELGDTLTVVDAEGNEYDTILLSRTTDLLRESDVSKGLSEYSNAASYSNDNLIALRGKTNRLYRDIEVTRSQITDVEQGLETTIEQTAAGLQIQIDDLQSQIDGEIAYYEREGAPTLLNYPYWDFCTNIPCDGTIQLGDGVPFVYTEQDRIEHRMDLCYDTESLIAYRFNQMDGVWLWQEIPNTETSLILSRISTLEATAEALTTEYNEVRYDLDNDYYTKVEANSQISQSANQIQTTVAATYATKTTTNNLQSQITQQAGQISAKVSSTGGTESSFAYTLNSSKFELVSGNKTVLKCDSTGISINGSGTFSGLVTASGGWIGDLKIYGSGIYSTDLTSMYVTPTGIKCGTFKVSSTSNTLYLGSHTYSAYQCTRKEITYVTDVVGGVPTKKTETFILLNNNVNYVLGSTS